MSLPSSPGFIKFSTLSFWYPLSVIWFGSPPTEGNILPPSEVGDSTWLSLISFLRTMRASLSDFCSFLFSISKSLVISINVRFLVVVLILLFCNGGILFRSFAAVADMNPAFVCHRDSYSSCFTVSNLLSCTTWNWGLTSPVYLSRTSATLRECCGDLPR